MFCAVLKSDTLSSQSHQWWGQRSLPDTSTGPWKSPEMPRSNPRHLYESLSSASGPELPRFQELRAARASSFFDSNIRYEKVGKKNMISYDVRSLFFLHGCLDEGSPFNKRLFSILLVEVIVSTVLAMLKCERGEVGFCLPLPDNTTGLTLLTITSFLVGLFSNNVLQRWWSIRVALGVVINKSMSLAAAVASVMAHNTRYSSTQIKQETLELMLKIRRYLNLAHALIYKNADGIDDVSDLIDDKLLTQDEAEVLLFSKNKFIKAKGTSTRSLFQIELDERNSTATNQNSSSCSDNTRSPFYCPFNVYSWVALNLENACSVGLLSAPSTPMNHIMSFLVDLGIIENAAAEVGMYIGIQLPYEFAQMTVVIVYMFLVQLVVVCGGLIGEGFWSGDFSLIVTGYMTSVLMTFVMLSILNMYDVLSSKALSSLPTTTYMEEEEEKMTELVESIWSSASARDSAGNFVVLPNFSFAKGDLVENVPKSFAV